MYLKLIKIPIFVLILFCSSCLLYEPMPNDWNWGFKPRPLTGVKNFPSTKTQYGKGFKDGCSSAWRAVTKGLGSDLETRIDFKRMKKTSDYTTGWFDGIEQCTYIVDWDVP
ncbi:MAG: hypothetical protein FJX30_00160 [Alphaproteobacteria bacterium]|nr:hypothetical protein [Alphaproteobacteria bacterium]